MSRAARERGIDQQAMQRKLNSETQAARRSQEKATKQAHTPGPWKAHLNEPTAIIPGHLIKADNETQTPIALLWVGGGTRGVERQEANARLMAAAPELLAALEQVESVVAAHSTIPELAGWWAQVAEAAIRKAKGE